MFEFASAFFLALLPRVVQSAPTSSGDMEWFVTDWSGGCVRRGCFYYFNITAPAYGRIPAFSAHCYGDEQTIGDFTGENFFKPCGVNDDKLGNRGVAAKFLPRESPTAGSPKTVSISFAYKDISMGNPGPLHNFTGYADAIFNQFVAPAANFTVEPTEYCNSFKESCT